MVPRKWPTRAAVAVLAVTSFACSSDGENPLSPEAVALTTGSSGQEVRVFKFGPDGLYDFEASATGGTLLFSSFGLYAEGNPLRIWQQDDPLAAPASVTVTEIVAAGMRVDSIVVMRVTDDGLISSNTLYNTATATADNLDYTYGTWFKFFNSVDDTPPPPSGGQGCTPGYWKQPQHFDSWVGYSPDDLFSSVFDDAFPGMTLLQVVAQGGGGLKALGRHTVAALLNTSNADVSYGYTTQGVIDAFNAAFASGEYEAQKNLFATENELGCSLN